MEKSIGFEFDSYMREIFQMEEVDIQTYSPLALAYIGDSVYDVVIKSLVLNQGNRQVQKLQDVRKDRLPCTDLHKGEGSCRRNKLQRLHSVQAGLPIQGY